jgi:hypothetical protein
MVVRMARQITKNESGMADSRQRPRPTARVLHPAALFSIDRSIGTILRETYRVFCRALNRAPMREGVTLGMWFALPELWAEDGISQTAISQRTATHAPAVVGVINSRSTKVSCGASRTRRIRATRKCY